MDLLDLPLTDPASVFFVLGLVILVSPLLAERVRLPGVIGLVVAGVAIGPQGLGLVERAGVVEQLGGVGILYLMFLAGLELDLAVLRDHRRSALVFGLATFAIPFGFGVAGALITGFSAAAALLIGSLWASHTLVAYPILRRGGIVADPAVAASVGATVITDTLALLVLAAVSGYWVDGDVVFLVRLVPGLLVLAGVTSWVLPRLARWFFVGIGPDRNLRFLFVLTALLGSAVLAEAVGIEGIVGAFLAGLSLNRLVPNGGTLMQRIEFVGSALLIPLFLISVGMLVDLGVVFDRDTLVLAAGFTSAAMGGKALAAYLAGRSFGFAPHQIGAMFALSNAQAAATLAATIVGFEIGLFDEIVVNAVLVVILVTVVVASWAAGRAVRGFAMPDRPPWRMGRVVLVPIANPAAASELIEVATWIARADGGEVIPLHVVTTPDPAELASARAMAERVVADAARVAGELDALVRVDRSVSRGVVNTAIERDASLVVLGWKGASTTRDRVLGTLLEDLVAELPCLTAACWMPAGQPARLVLAADHESALERDVLAATELFGKLARGSSLLTVVASAPPDTAAELGSIPRIEAPDATLLAGALRPADTVVLPAPRGRDLVGPAARELAARRPDVNVIVVHGALPMPRTEVGEVFAGP